MDSDYFSTSSYPANTPSTEELTKLSQLRKLLTDRDQESTSAEIISTKDAVSIKDDNSNKENTTFEDRHMTKRAALISKIKAENGDSVLTQQSANQKRAALYKNKHRKSIRSEQYMKAKKAERKSEPKPEPAREDQESPMGSVIYVSHNELQDTVNHGLRIGRIDTNDDEQVASVMQFLTAVLKNESSLDDNKKAGDGAREHSAVHEVRESSAEKSNGTDVLKEISNDDLHENFEAGGEVVKLQRKKGKARKETKNKVVVK